MIIRTQKDREAVIAKINAIDLDKNGKPTPWRVDAEPFKKDRSLAQNRLAFKWYAELGKQSANGKDHERRLCKFTYGCPILIESDDDGEFTGFYEKLIENYDYEQCVSAMDFIQITSMMNVKQFAEYLSHVELYAGEHGYRLTHPDDLYDEAMGRTREKTV